MTSPTQKHRIEYIDILRGLCILWVVWFHLPNLGLNHYPIRMPLFFFLSGIFFKEYTLNEFVFKKINTLLIPFIFFCLIGYFYKLGIYEFFSHFSTHGEDATFDFSSIFSMFSVIWTGEVTINPPLWFIAALLFFQIILYSIIRIFRSLPGRIVCCLLVSAVIIATSPSNGTILHNNLWLFIFYCAGFLFGKPFLKRIESTPIKSVIAPALIGIALFAAIYFIPKPSLPTIARTIGVFAYSILIFEFIIVFKYLAKFRIFHTLKFWGSNSYAVLGTHLIAMEILSTFYCVIFNTTLASALPQVILFVVTVVSVYPVILFLNRYCPMLVGKKGLMTYKTAGREERPAVTTAAE